MESCWLFNYGALASAARFATARHLTGTRFYLPGLACAVTISVAPTSGPGAGGAAATAGANGAVTITYP